MRVVVDADVWSPTFDRDRYVIDERARHQFPGVGSPND